MDEDFPVESRTGVSGLWGKLDAEMPKYRCSMTLLTAAQHEAARLGMSLAEFQRTLMEISLFGEDHVKNLQAQRISQVARMGVAK